ncbi:MAG: hypothetical protein GF411_13835 [Candidatus Lokiarchaeota archaeon]|nr:hypothetical protein [Candidatus Lokiarchaeota archaeon]
MRNSQLGSKPEYYRKLTMPFYDYKCESCGAIQEIMHKMSESPNITCTECGNECTKTLENMNLTTYVKGNGIVNDRAGAKRDMHLYNLQNKDPYSMHRVDGEKDYLENKLRNAGKHQKNTKTFVGSSKKNK